MIRLLVLLFHLFPYGRTQTAPNQASGIPLLVRSPYLNCWTYDSSYDIEDAAARNAAVVAVCDDSIDHRKIFEVMLFSHLD